MTEILDPFFLGSIFNNSQ